MVSATINDIFGWSVFALILTSLNANIRPSLDLILTVGMLAMAFGVLYLIKRKEPIPLSHFGVASLI